MYSLIGIAGNIDDGHLLPGVDLDYMLQNEENDLDSRKGDLEHGWYIPCDELTTEDAGPDHMGLCPTDIGKTILPISTVHMVCQNDGVDDVAHPRYPYNDRVDAHPDTICCMDRSSSIKSQSFDQTTPLQWSHERERIRTAVIQRDGWECFRRDWCVWRSHGRRGRKPLTHRQHCRRKIA